MTSAGKYAMVPRFGDLADCCVASADDSLMMISVSEVCDRSGHGAVVTGARSARTPTVTGVEALGVIHDEIEDSLAHTSSVRAPAAERSDPSVAVMFRSSILGTVASLHRASRSRCSLRARKPCCTHTVANSVYEIIGSIDLASNH